MSAFDELVKRLTCDETIGVHPTRTPTGVKIDNGRVYIDLRGTDRDFDRFVHSLDRDAKDALGTPDGLGLYIANLQERLETSDTSMVYEFHGKHLKRHPV